MTIRAAVLKKRLYKPSVTESAMGAAIVAASKTVYRSLAEATEAMVRYDYVVEPDSKLVDPYEEAYRKFRRECNERGLGT
jgi:sugar (pentulose or hexulose) kinase